MVNIFLFFASTVDSTTLFIFEDILLTFLKLMFLKKSLLKRQTCNKIVPGEKLYVWSNQLHQSSKVCF